MTKKLEEKITTSTSKATGKRFSGMPASSGSKASCRSGFKNPAAPAVKREAEEDWGKEKWR